MTTNEIEKQLKQKENYQLTRGQLILKIQLNYVAH